MAIQKIINIAPIIIYGSSISYFTGKLENYFRVKGISYQLKPMTSSIARVMRKETGTTQMPAIQFADGTWMTDSTMIIQWFEEQYPESNVIPTQALPHFFSLLLEDYADEWLWRPAMHYRWHYSAGARFASTHLSYELAGEVPAPQFLKRFIITRRQKNGYTTGDGIRSDQVAGIENIYLRTLNQMEQLLSVRPFLLGDTPSLADIGFSGPFFRHFGLDPVPAEIMRQQAPKVYQWIARLWNSDINYNDGELDSNSFDDLGPILREIGECYLPYLNANVDAVRNKQKRFDADIGGVKYRGARWSIYRVWCLQKIRDYYNDMDGDSQSTAKALLQKYNCWNVLWQEQDLPITDEVCSQLPFFADAKMIDVYH